jgi:hypothetical protein
VTLATCDSGNQTTVLVPGGSIAHDLHVEGVPWVFASQFPLTVPGSVRMAEALYPRLFRGDDPRQILFELRRQLYRSAQGDHDWASLVAYAALPRDFQNQVSDFYSRQVKQAINVLLERADGLAVVESKEDEESKEKTDARQQEIRSIIREVEEWLRVWRSRGTVGSSPDERVRRSEMIAMHGSTYKRIALLLAKTRGRKDPAEISRQEDPEIKSYYRKALEHYRNSMNEAAAANVKYYWSATQVLSLQAVRGEGRDPDAHNLASALAKRDTDSKEEDGARAWAYATLAELELLRGYHARPEPYDKAAIAKIIEDVKNYCGQVVAIAGPRSFHAGSTLRQFSRYLYSWPNEEWNDIAKAAIEVFRPAGSAEPEFDYPEDN